MAPDDDLAPYEELCERPERWTVSRFSEALRETLGLLRRARNEAETYRVLYEQGPRGSGAEAD